MNDKQVYNPSDQDILPDIRRRDSTAPEPTWPFDPVNPFQSPDLDASGRHPSQGSSRPLLGHSNQRQDENEIDEKLYDDGAGQNGAQEAHAPGINPVPNPRRGIGTGAIGTAHGGNDAEYPDEEIAPDDAPEATGLGITGTTGPDPSSPPTATDPAASTQAQNVGLHMHVWHSVTEFCQWIADKLSQARRNHPVKFWIIVVGTAIVLCFSTLGVPVGVTVGKWGKPQPSATPPTPPAPPGLYRKSKIGATFWKNSNNETVHQIVWQDDTYALLTARRIEGTPGWVVTNISQISIQASTPITVLPGSPLTFATPDFVNMTDIDRFWTDLFFLTPSNTPNQIWHWNLPGFPGKDDLWHPNVLAAYQAIFPGGFANGTSLFAYRDSCATNCSASTRLFYQAGTWKVFMAVSKVTNWSFWWTVELSRQGNSTSPNTGSTSPTEPLANISSANIQNIERGSPLAVTRVAPANITQGTEPSDMRLFVDSSHWLQEYIYSSALRTWTRGPNEWFLGDQNTPPEVVATSYPTSSGQPLNNVLTAIVFENGTIGLHWWSVSAPEKYQSASPVNVQGVTSLAITDDRAFCVQGDKLNEYKISWSNPGTWTFVGTVPTATTV